MRSTVSRFRLKYLSQVAAIAVIAGLTAGCSSGFSRFDRDLYDALPRSSSANTGNAGYQNNPYPGDVDSTTTASIDGGGPTPLATVSPDGTAPDHAGYTPAGTETYARQQNYGQPNYATAQRDTAAYRSGVIRSDLPQPAATLPPATAPDPVLTGSVNNATSSAPRDNGAPRHNGVGGWTAAGGTSITLGSGETLHNVSKRYGVPVREIMKANNIANADSVNAGRRIVIPTYVYSSAAPVSAPDNNPDTRAARATSGRIGQPEFGRVAIPTKRPARKRQLASANASGVDPIVTGSLKKDAKQPKPYVKPDVDGIATGSVDAKAPASTGIERFRWPVKGRVISAFGESRGTNTNDGIDISVPEGTAVKAAENGVVIYSGNELAGFGNLVLIRHAEDFVTAYAHNSKNAVAKGTQVRRGQVIAQSGRTGDATVPMLHFEVRKNSKPVDPIKYLGG